MVTERDEEWLAELLLDWEELQEQGRDVSIHELCRECPHLADELARRIQALTAIAWLDKSIDDQDDSPLVSREADNASRILAGRYRLETLIAEGGFAHVWKGFDQELHRYVAIKLPKSNRINSTDAFIEEARRVARLKHPSIVPVHDVGRDDGVCFIVSEFVEGGSLAELIRARSFTELQAIRWSAEISDALHYAHSHGVIHQDVKPANILIDQHGRAFLTDFGIAQDQMKTGTLRYMSPEQLEGKPVCPQSDVYSLGVVLHELLSGKQPYLSDEPVALSREILRGASLGRLTKTHRQICQKALHRRVNERYENASQMADDLRRSIALQAKGIDPWRVVLPIAFLALLGPPLWISLRSTNVPAPNKPESQVGEVRLIKGGPQVLAVAFSPDGKYLLTGELFHTVSLWNAETGERMREYQGLENWVRCVAYAPDGKWIIAGSGGNDDGQGRLVAGSNNFILQWNVQTGEEIRRFDPIDSPITSVAISVEGSEVLSGSDDGIVRLWDVKTGRESKRLLGHTAMVRCVRFVPGTRWALSGGGDSVLRLWDLDSGEIIRCFSGHRDMVESVACASDGRTIVSGGKDNTVRLWDVQTGHEIRRFEGHAYHVRSVCFSPDDRLLVSGGFDGTVRLWDVASGGMLQVLMGHQKGITSVAFSPNGRRVLSGSVDGTAGLWALPPQWSPDEVTPMQFDPPATRDRWQAERTAAP